MAVLKAHTAQSQVRAVAKHTHRSEAPGGSACVLRVVAFRVVGARPSQCLYQLAELGQLILQGCACWSDYARWQNPTVLRPLLGDAATLRVESPHGQSGRRVDRQSELRMVEYFGVANGFLRLTCCRVINLVLGVTRSSSRSPYNHAALLGADFEKHVLRLQAQL